MRDKGPFWIAQRHGQDWRDDKILSAIAWLTAMVPAADWARRMDVVRANFTAAWKDWAQQKTVALFDPSDTISWYVFQANAYASGASGRKDWFEPEAFRIAPVFQRLGQVLDDLKAVGGVEARASKLMIQGRDQIDDGLYELLVAAAYKRRGWAVNFVAEKKGVAKTQDLLVTSASRRWAVECKRVNRSGYEAEERVRGEELARPIHERCRELNRSVAFGVRFQVELKDVPNDYLLAHLEGYLRNGEQVWHDQFGRGGVGDIDWRAMQAVLSADDIFYGSSRMIELLLGEYVATADHSIAARWTPAEARPLYATSMSQASVVMWISDSMEAARRKARHFRGLVGQASQQLPGDCPGVVHVGYEARDGNAVNGLRHKLNRDEMKTFSSGETQLRWVYGNYMTPEHTNDPNESFALSETTASYKIGRHRTSGPLPDHLLFSDEGGVPGVHWTR